MVQSQNVDKMKFNLFVDFSFQGPFKLILYHKDQEENLLPNKKKAKNNNIKATPLVAKTVSNHWKEFVGIF